MFVFILGARSRKPFQSQLFELSLRQRIGSMVSRTRLNLRRLYFSLCLFLHLFSNFLYKLHTILRIIDVFHWVYKPFIFKIFFQISKLFAREGKQFTPFTSLVAKLKEIKCPSQSTESLKSRWKVFISFKVIWADSLCVLKNFACYTSRDTYKFVHSLCHFIHDQ